MISLIRGAASGPPSSGSGLARAQARVASTTLAWAGALSVLAAAIHVRVAPEHFSQWWGYGAFFVACALAEVGYLWLLARHPGNRVLQVGIWGSMATMLMYFVSRTAGIPLGPEAGVVETVDGIGATATAAEAGLLLLLCSLLDGDARRRTLNALALVGVALWVASLTGALTPPPQAAAAGHHHGGTGSASEGHHDEAEAHDLNPIPFIPDSVRNAPRPRGIG
jgi:hypothetical protein